MFGQKLLNDKVLFIDIKLISLGVSIFFLSVQKYMFYCLSPDNYVKALDSLNLV